MKRSITCVVTVLALLVPGTFSVSAETIDVKSFRYSGPYSVIKPFQVDTVDINGRSYGNDNILDAPLSFEALRNAPEVSSISSTEAESIHLLGFALQNTGYAIAKLNISGLEHYRIWVDGKKNDGSLKLEPGTHEVVIKALAAGDCDSLKLSVEEVKGSSLALRSDGGRIFSLDINSMGVSGGTAEISAGGKYAIIGVANTAEDGKTSKYNELVELSTGKVLFRTGNNIEWMPNREAYSYTRPGIYGRDLICADPATGIETAIASRIPEGWYQMAPTEDFLIYSLVQEGPEEGDVHQILVPDDRQPGWRNRSYLAKYDINTGFMQNLTFGWHNSWLCDISDDGKQIIFATSRQRLTERPTDLYSYYLMDLSTLETECLVEDDGFVMGASFSPDGKQVLFGGTAEAFGKIGMIELPEGRIPNGTDNQLFVMDLKDRSVRPLTKDFYPSVEGYEWSRADGKIYTRTYDKDRYCIWRIDPRSCKADRINVSEDYVYGFSLASKTPMMVYRGQSLCNADRSYVFDLKKNSERILHDFHVDRMAGVDIGFGDDYEFVNSRGESINGFYVLPPDFDPAKKYPMIVHYYGGCSPSQRYMTGSYSPHLYSAQGYVFYVINPSGASGFGQEFASRHVNTAGDFVADDIIEGTKKFCEDHPFVDTTHIGCFSASYGGFMTQLLLIKSDIYATGISHAGISDHTSYWGEGYWGYSYSQISMADSYPWTRTDLYVDRSPLYNADKIHTPLLFLHGSSDTNVPIGESIQMFTALKILGAETAFVVVDGEDHHINDYTKRRDWLRTASAWFAKYLKEDPTWWNEMYPDKNL